MGSMIQKIHGRDLKGCPDVLCLEKPEVITQIHEAYLEAGADIISTCSFSANAVSLADYGLAEKAYEISKAAGELARKAADTYSKPDKKRFAAGSMGPTSKSGSICQDINDPEKRSITWDELETAYYDNARGLLDGGADLLLLETIFDTLNAKAAIAAVLRLREERNADIPLIISASVDNEGGRLLSGQNLEAFVVSVSHAEPFAIGLNCSFGAEKILPHLSALSSFSPFPISCYPNAGFPDVSGTYSEGPEQTARIMKQFFEQGLVNIVGGCCGTTPDHIAAIAGLAKKYPPRSLLLREKPVQNFLSGLEVFPLPHGTGESKETCDHKLSALIKNNKMEDAVDHLSEMIETGADSIKIYLGDELSSEKEKVVRFINTALFDPAIARAPIMLESADWEILEAALKCIQGKSLVKISLEKGDDNFHRFAALIRRYGAELVVK